MDTTMTSPPTQQMSNTNSISNPLLISMVGIAVTALAITLYHMLLVRYCIRRPSAAVRPPRSTASPAGGVDEKVLESIPISAFSAVKRDTKDQDECVVCLGEIDDDEMVRLLPVCRHAFHVACVDLWFAAHASCPVCRSPVIAVAADRSDGGGESSSSEQASAEVRSSPSPSPVRLKRSVSMDPSFVAIDLTTVNYSCSMRSRSMIARSGSMNFNRLDRVSSKLRRSFSRLRLGKGAKGTILPY